MPWYMTEYVVDWSHRPAGKATPGNYGAYLWANNRRHALRVAAARGLNERIIAPAGNGKIADYFPADLMCQRYMQSKTLATFTDAMHALSYLGMLALASGRASPHEIVGDNGILHGFIHLRLRRAFCSKWPDLRFEIQEVQRRVPGYLRKR